MGGVQIWCSLQNCRSSLIKNWNREICKLFCSVSKFVPQSFHHSLGWPHNWDLFFIFEGLTCSYLLFSFYYVLWLNIIHSYVFPLWGSAALIADQLNSSSAGSHAKALPNSSRLCPFASPLSEMTGGSWRMLPLSPDLGLSCRWLVQTVMNLVTVLLCHPPTSTHQHLGREYRAPRECCKGKWTEVAAFWSL